MTDDLFSDTNVQRERGRIARAARDEGMQRVSDNAERLAGGWNDRAIATLLEFIAAVPSGTLFMVDDFRQWAHGRIDEPHDSRAWGSITRKAARAGKIAQAGFAPQPHRHMAPGTVWRVV